MSLTNYQAMDPNMLYSLVNTKLRNEYRDLDELVSAMELDRAVLERRLAAAGFYYWPELNQFRGQAPQ
ncbi:DUF4250 domain-containing protein [Ectothiorhodospiraceae bacterium 2226]|nr:DUF4250 domain-containing protein [Ectothiorhodospiraceae bacterium 2226]